MKSIKETAHTVAAIPDQQKTGSYFLVFLLVLCLVQFFGAWIFPPAVFGGVQTMVMDKRFGVPFQYMLWSLILLTAFQLSARQFVTPFVKVLTPFFPFMLLGLLSAVFGYDPFGSVRILILWMVMAIGAVTIGSGLSQERALAVTLKTIFILLLASVVFSVLIPSYGTQQYGGGTVWRGLFVHKNQFGWFAALSLAIGAIALRRGWSWLAAAVALLSIVCIVGSGSKGALLIAIFAVAYGYFIAMLARHVTPGFGVGVVLFTAIAGAVFAALAFPLVLELLGRDATLTGRTDVWRTYFNAMSATPWFGQGPGSYTSLSPLTSVLARRLADLGAIVTPHNSFLGAFGDAGLFGVAAFIGLLLYVSLVEPLRHPSFLFILSGTLGCLIVVGGLSETHDVFTAGPGWFLLILVRTLALRERAGAPAQPVVPPHQAPIYYPRLHRP